ncbi:hypothetical protein E2C01_063732 [Portunus trituberculatus]|uniref:Uncharacterized protein n=1 Tax=Portunus trituberculatus TaxID=210409 RepID=A0A5B7HHW1_PORTR|nr:hypothetical protein [Portunus trituberculatus]
MCHPARESSSIRKKMSSKLKKRHDTTTTTTTSTTVLPSLSVSLPPSFIRLARHSFFFYLFWSQHRQNTGAKRPPHTKAECLHCGRVKHAGQRRY